jgi:branched-chain amino acid aminotransferase
MATLAESEMTFAHLPHPAPLAADARAAVLADPGFGKVFSDHMVSIDWDEERGWHTPPSFPMARSRSTRPPRCCTMPRKSSKG